MKLRRILNLKVKVYDDMFQFENEIKRLIDLDCPELAFSQCIISIELLGAFLDKKPLKAKKQSSKRFTLGLRKLFPKPYGNPKVIKILYDCRCNLSHLSLHSSFISFSENEHLTWHKETLQFRRKIFVSDFIIALQKLSDKINSGEISPKQGFRHL